MNEYDVWEKDYKKNRAENKKLLDEFAQWLKQFGFVKKTVNAHVSNVEFYINEFLLYEKAIPAQDGYSEISWFLGFWFIKKALWSSVSSIKQNIASLKKFYKFLLEKGDINIKQFNELKQIIKAEQKDWLETMKRFDNPDIVDMEDVWQI